MVKRKVAAVIERSGLSPRSHSGKDLMAILEDYPRDELFQITTDDLYDTVMGVLRLAGRRQLRLFVRRDLYGRFISCLVYLPRDRFTTANRLAIQDDPAARAATASASTSPPGWASRCWPGSTSSCAPTRPRRRPTIDVEAIQEQLVEATRNWDDDFRLLLERKLGDEQSKAAATSRYVDALPDSYKDVHTPGEAAKDLAKLELLEEPGQLEMHVYRRRTDDQDVRFKVYRYGEPMMLSTVLPVLHSLGVRVADERPYEIAAPDGTDLRLRLRPGPAGRRARARRRAAARGERVRGDLARRGRGRRLQRAGGPRRADLAAGGGAAGVREVPAPGRHGLRAGVDGGDVHRVSRASRRCWSRCSRRGSRRRWTSTDDDRALQSDGTDRPRSGGSSTTWRASTRTGSCART